jgi:hypothetical protein
VSALLVLHRANLPDIQDAGSIKEVSSRVSLAVAVAVPVLEEGEALGGGSELVDADLEAVEGAGSGARSLRPRELRR